MIRTLRLGVAGFLLAFQCCAWAQVTLYSDRTNDTLQFASGDIQSALLNNGQKTKAKNAIQSIAELKGTNIVVGLKTNQTLYNNYLASGGLAIGPLTEQAYALRKTTTDDAETYWVIGGDLAGAMYGGLRLAEIINHSGLKGFAAEDESPFIKQRGIKFNITLDVRTPSFADNGSNADMHREYVWDVNFWKAWIDDAARYRYNLLSLWSRHPFPALVKLDKYPEVAMNDVYNRDGLVLKMSIDEKIAMWQEVIRYAKSRCVNIIWVDWNIHLDHAKKFNLVESGYDERTKDYIRESTKALFRTYPELHGIGVTAGERMRELESAEQKEQWLLETYGQAVMEIAKEQPERQILFMHRYWWTTFENIIDHFKPLMDQPNIQFDMSFKYARARLYSAPAPVFAKESVLKTLPLSLKSWWNLRNDDILTFRWGDPDYVKAFLRNLPPEHQTAGYYMGSDRYVWGRETILRDAESPRQLQTKFNWYRFMLWGRLGYNPNIPNQLFQNTMAQKYPELPSETLFSAWQDASQSFPLATKFHWHDWDYMWHVETCSGYDKELTGLRATERFYDVLMFIDNPTMEGSGLINIKKYTELFVKGKAPVANTPLSHAALMKLHANNALATLKNIKPAKEREAKLVLNDIEAMAKAGLYYGHKIEAATYHSLFLATQKPVYKKLAIQHMLRSYKAWESYIGIFSKQYHHGLISILTREVDYDELLKSVQRDVELVGGHYKDPLEPLPKML